MASLRVVEKLGLRREGFYERYLDIDGAWRDHIAFAVTVEELAGRTMLVAAAPRCRACVPDDPVPLTASSPTRRATYARTLNSQGYVESTL